MKKILMTSILLSCVTLSQILGAAAQNPESVKVRKLSHIEAALAKLPQALERIAKRTEAKKEHFKAQWVERKRKIEELEKLKETLKNNFSDEQQKQLDIARDQLWRNSVNELNFEHEQDSAQNEIKIEQEKLLAEFWRAKYEALMADVKKSSSEKPPAQK